jgi:uncharacterized protein
MSTPLQHTDPLPTSGEDFSSTPMRTRTTAPFQLTFKPSGSRCNLACRYCAGLSTPTAPARPAQMDAATLERITAAYLRAHPGPDVAFVWQGGEPLLMGLDFFKRAFDLQARYRMPGQRLINTIQTNGTLLTDEWAALLATHAVQVGIRLDGPAELHDVYRCDAAGKPSHTRARSGLSALQRHGVPTHALVAVTRANVDHPQRVYRYLTGLGLAHLHLLPVVERESPTSRKVTAASVAADRYGAFLCTLFDCWGQRDVGRVFIQLFESTLNVWLDQPAGMCTFAPTCGWELAVDPHGNLFACDYFAGPDDLRGPVTADTLPALVEGLPQRAFGLAKADLPTKCRQCSVLRFCGGDCPKHRLRLMPDRRYISYLCPAYHQFFTHSAPMMQALVSKLRAAQASTP